MCLLKNNWWGSFGASSVCCRDMYNLGCCRSSTFSCSCHFVQGKYNFLVDVYDKLICITLLQDALMDWDMVQDERCLKLKIYPILQKVLSLPSLLFTHMYIYEHIQQTCINVPFFSFFFFFPYTLIFINRNCIWNLSGVSRENFEKTRNRCICWGAKSTPGYRHLFYCVFGFSLNVVSYYGCLFFFLYVCVSTESSSARQFYCAGSCYDWAQSSKCKQTLYKYKVGDMMNLDLLFNLGYLGDFCTYAHILFWCPL